MKFRMIVCIAMCSACCVLPVVSAAQVGAGAFEIAGTGTFHSVANSKVYQFAVEGGQFLQDQHEVGARVSFSKFDSEESSALTGLYSFHFNPEDQAVMFLNGGFGLGNGLPLNALLPGQTQPRTNFSDLHMALGAGMKAFLLPAVALRVDYAYNRVWTDIDNFDVHSVLFGLSVFFHDR